MSTLDILDLKPATWKSTDSILNHFHSTSNESQLQKATTRPTLLNSLQIKFQSYQPPIVHFSSQGARSQPMITNLSKQWTIAPKTPGQQAFHQHFSICLVKWCNLKSPVSSAAILVGLFGCWATFNSRAILLLLTPSCQTTSLHPAQHAAD